ncbi:MAG TPA: hypothetical protein VGK32_14005 [Vicinamibacterales bacterium]
MDRQLGAEQKPGRGRRLGRGVLVAYLSTGAALAVVRVSLNAWAEYRSISQQMTETVYNLYWLLRPEILLAEYDLLGVTRIENWTLRVLFWSSLLTLGSFIMATPILLVGWLRQRRRYVVTGATLAVARLALLACVTHRFSSDTVNEVFHRLRWALFPEALLVTHTVLGQMSISRMMILLVGGALLTLGSFILATPILLVGWLRQRRR